MPNSPRDLVQQAHSCMASTGASRSVNVAVTPSSSKKADVKRGTVPAILGMSVQAQCQHQVPGPALSLC